MTALSDFITNVSLEINKGTTLDAYIARRIKMAGRRLEQNYTYKYMEKMTTLTLAAGANYVTIPARFKSLEWMRYTDDDGTFHQLNQVDATQILNEETDVPTGFWTHSTYFATAAASEGRWYFDCSPTVAITLTAMIVYYSDWEAATSFWLLTNAESLLLAEVMIMLAPFAREPKWPELYKQMREEGEKTVFIADQELRRAAADETMLYANRGSS